MAPRGAAYERPPTRVPRLPRCARSRRTAEASTWVLRQRPPRPAMMSLSAGVGPCYIGAQEVRFMKLKLTAVFEQVPEGYIGYVEELPGANTQADTLEEARAGLQEALFGQHAVGVENEFD